VAGFTFLLQTSRSRFQGLEPCLASLPEFRSLSADMVVFEGRPDIPDGLEIGWEIRCSLILNEDAFVFCEFHGDTVGKAQ